MKFLVLVNYLGKFCKNLAEIIGPSRQLIRKDTDFQWRPNCEKIFQQIKKLISEAPLLKVFDNTEVTLQVDASIHTLGTVIMQSDRPVECANKPLNDVQVRYSRIEKEMLAILFGCRKFHYYAYGGPECTVQLCTWWS